MNTNLAIIVPLLSFITLFGINCGTTEFKAIETDVAKAILLNRMVHPSDNLFERRTKSLVANFLVNTAIVTRQETVSSTEGPGIDYYDYGTIFTDADQSTTTQRVFTWPPFFHNKITTKGPFNYNKVNYADEEKPIIPAASIPTIQVTETSSTFRAPTESLTTTEDSEPIIPYVEKKPPPPRRPAGLIGAIQYMTLIVPDALRPGRNTTSLLNRQSITSILKIIGSVAFLNLTGVIDNSVSLGTSAPVRELVDGVTNLVFCNQLVQGVNGGRCHRRLFEGETLDLKTFMDHLNA